MYGQDSVKNSQSDPNIFSIPVCPQHDNHYNNRKCANNTDIPSSDPGIDIGSSHILVKMPFLSPLKDTSTDSYTFDQLEHYTQVLHSGTMLRSGIQSPELPMHITFVLVKQKKSIKFSVFLSKP